MNIEIINKLKGVEITEYSIRDVRSEDYDKPSVMVPNFQVHLESQKSSAIGNVEFNISYYSENDSFLGYDKGERDLDSTKSKYSASIPLTVPEGAFRAKCEITGLDVWEHDFKSWSYRIAAVLVMLLLFQCVLKGFVDLF